jgi:hypothetical protein
VALLEPGEVQRAATAQRNTDKKLSDEREMKRKVTRDAIRASDRKSHLDLVSSKWNANYDIIARFLNANGRFPNAEEALTESGLDIAKWVRRQAENPNNFQTEDQQERLHRLPGWDEVLATSPQQAVLAQFGAGISDRDQELLRALDGFIARTGHLRVPRHHVEGAVELGERMAEIRQLRLVGQLPQLLDGALAARRTAADLRR